jgi:6-phosphogluconolactonase (cycloisomerase 2 family)
MKSGKWAVGLLAAALLMSGCSGFWNAPATTTTTTTTTLSSGYFFVMDEATSQVISYDIVSGTLTEIGATALPSTPLSMAVAPNSNFLYVSTAGGIYVYTIASGVLTLSSNQVSTDPAVVMQVDFNNDWLLETSGGGTLNAIPIVTATGAVDSTRKTATVPLNGSTINGLAIAPNDEYVFAALGSNGTAAYGFTYTSATPFQSSAYRTIPVVTSSAGAALSIAVDPSSRLLYVGEADAVSSSGGLRAFTIGAAGVLTEISGSPKSSGGTGPHAILPTASGDYVYVANWSGTSAGNITGFSLTDTNSVFSLTVLSNSVATGVEPMGLVEDSEGNFVIAVSALGNPYLDAYYFDTTTAGQLDATITSSSFQGSAIAAEQP